MRLASQLLTSMEPPCEHGGVFWILNSSPADRKLQWSRRVNTAEWRCGGLGCGPGNHTSMEPPCEHGGVQRHGQHEP